MVNIRLNLKCLILSPEFNADFKLVKLVKPNRLHQLLVMFSHFFIADNLWGNISDESFGSDQHLSLHFTPHPYASFEFSILA